jgi:hypothetical protein
MIGSCKGMFKAGVGLPGAIAFGSLQYAFVVDDFGTKPIIRDCPVRHRIKLAQPDDLCSLSVRVHPAPTSALSHRLSRRAVRAHHRHVV